MFRDLTFDMSGGPKGAKRPLERPLDGGVRCLRPVHGAFWQPKRSNATCAGVLAGASTATWLSAAVLRRAACGTNCYYCDLRSPKMDSRRRFLYFALLG